MPAQLLYHINACHLDFCVLVDLYPMKMPAQMLYHINACHLDFCVLVDLYPTSAGRKGHHVAHQPCKAGQRVPCLLLWVQRYVQVQINLDAKAVMLPTSHAKLVSVFLVCSCGHQSMRTAYRNLQTKVRIY